MIVVEAQNRKRSISSSGNCDPFQSLSGAFHWYHNQQRRSARLKNLRSRTPRPSSFFGRHTTFQFTQHLPPMHELSPFQNYALQRLSIRFCFHTGISSTVNWYIGIAVSTVFRIVNLPALDNILLLYPTSLASTLSIRGWRCTCRSLRSESDNPRYVHGKYFLVAENFGGYHPG